MLISMPYYTFTFYDWIAHDGYYILYFDVEVNGWSKELQ